MPALRLSTSGRLPVSQFGERLLHVGGKRCFEGDGQFHDGMVELD